MRSITDKGSFEDTVSASTPELAAIATRLRDLIISLDPDVVEVSWARQRISGYGVGPKKMSEHYTYVAPLKRHVNLGFYRGASLADPAGLLEGGGKAMRHVKVRKLDHVDTPTIRALITAARLERRAALGLDD